MNDYDINSLIDTKLSKRSKDIRLESIKISKANGGYHYGGSFSSAEILITLYDKILTDEDKFILSKGHACWVYYVLLQERGFNPVLEGHPHLDLQNGVHWTTGSEGHGFPAGIGIAFAMKQMKKKGKVYVLMGDGECQEGTTWESLLLASHLELDNLVIIVDYNKIQGSGYVKDILPMESILSVVNSLNWEMMEVNGHDLRSIENTIKNMSKDKTPKFIFAHTVKGKGVSYMENAPEWHAKWPDQEHEKIAIDELSK